MRHNLKTARKNKGMTQQAMAYFLDITVRQYQRFETGETLGKIAHWDMLEDLLGIPQRTLRIISHHDDQLNSQPTH
jgi:transcriptional regulator with XRE-family HTH domain